MSDLNIELYKKMYLIRMAEEAIREYYMEDEMKTPIHLYIGGEAVVSGVCQALSEKDKVFGTYRSHGVYLARTQETDKFFAELYGKQTGLSSGKAGSMHIMSPEQGLVATSAIVGTTISMAVGNAFASQYKDDDAISVVFFGDGAIDEGTFWESVNLACLKKLPVLFVCEDNNFAIHTPANERHGYSSITDVISEFDCSTFGSDTTDAEEIHTLTQKAIGAIKKDERPAFLHLKYYRYFSHVGIDADFDAGYRSKDEYDEWQKIDPVELGRKKLLQTGMDEDSVSSLEQEIKDKIYASISDAKAAPHPEDDELYTHIFS